MVDTNLTIQDIGIRSVTRGGTETVIANTGVPITLKTRSVSLKIPIEINSEITSRFRSGDSSNEFVMGEIDKGAIGFRTWNISCEFNMNDSTDVENLGYLCFMAQTKGYKKISFTDSSTNTNVMRWVCKDVNNTPLTYIYGRISSESISQNYSNTLKGHIVVVSFEFIETN